MVSEESTDLREEILRLQSLGYDDQQIAKRLNKGIREINILMNYCLTLCIFLIWTYRCFNLIAVGCLSIYQKACTTMLWSFCTILLFIVVKFIFLFMRNVLYKYGCVYDMSYNEC